MLIPAHIHIAVEGCRWAPKPITVPFANVVAVVPPDAERLGVEYVMLVKLPLLAGRVALGVILVIASKLVGEDGMVDASLDAADEVVILIEAS